MSFALFTSFLGIVITGKTYVEKGKNIVFTCYATGKFFPPEDIDWFKDGSKVKQDQYEGISISMFRDSKTLQSKLEIDHSDMTDSGTYTEFHCQRNFIF